LPICIERRFMTPRTHTAERSRDERHRPVFEVRPRGVGGQGWRDREARSGAQRRAAARSGMRDNVAPRSSDVAPHAVTRLWRFQLSTWLRASARVSRPHCGSRATHEPVWRSSSVPDRDAVNVNAHSGSWREGGGDIVARARRTGQCGSRVQYRTGKRTR
jgi:hypothetical protein